jgi:hypothetical protein
MTWGDVFTSKNRLLMNCDAASKLAPPAHAGETPTSEFPEIWSVCALGACCCAVHGVRTIVAGEGALEVDLLDLLLEEIDLVEEENERSLGEPWAVANLIKQQQRLCSHAQPKAHSISTHRYAPHTHTHTHNTHAHTRHTRYTHTHTHTHDTRY